MDVNKLEACDHVTKYCIDRFCYSRLWRRWLMNKSPVPGFSLPSRWLWSESVFSLKNTLNNRAASWGLWQSFSQFLNELERNAIWYTFSIFVFIFLGESHENIFHGSFFTKKLYFLVKNKKYNFFNKKLYFVPLNINRLFLDVKRYTKYTTICKVNKIFLNVLKQSIMFTGLHLFDRKKVKTVILWNFITN